MTDMQTELIAINKQILAELQIAGRMNSDLWSAQEIADYMKLSKSRVQGAIINCKTFPRPVVMPSGCKRWIAKEVKGWVMKARA